MKPCDPTAWGHCEERCEWCGDPWDEGESLYMFNPEQLGGHEMIVCKECNDGLWENYLAADATV
jgi:hypothetical protein